MIPPSQQKEYIITEEELQLLLTVYKSTYNFKPISRAMRIEDKVHSRPYDPAAIQKAERERVLDQAIHILEKVRNTFDATGFLVVDHKLPVLYLDEAKAAIKCGIAELREQEEVQR